MSLDCPGLVLAFAVTGYAAALMVSPFSYLSLKQIDVDKRVKYSYFAFVITPMLILIHFDPPTMLFAMFVSYATYGPVQWLVRKLRRPRVGVALRSAHGTVAQCLSRRARYRSLGSQELAT